MTVNKQKIAEPDLRELFQRRINNLKSEINCISIGTIQSFNATKQTATISMNFLRRIMGGTPVGNNQSSDSTIPYPLLVNCPVVFLFGGGASLTFPVTAGDTCLVLFCDRDIDNWFDNGQTNIPKSTRAHDLNDGIALVGIRSMQNILSSYYTGGPELKQAGASIKIDGSGNIIIHGAGNVTIEGSQVRINP